MTESECHTHVLLPLGSGNTSWKHLRKGGISEVSLPRGISEVSLPRVYYLPQTSSASPKAGLGSLKHCQKRNLENNAPAKTSCLLGGWLLAAELLRQQSHTTLLCLTDIPTLSGLRARSRYAECQGVTGSVSNT